jgi:DNA ligase-4
MFRREASMSVPPEVRGADTGLQETVYPAQPQNKGTAPFHVLATLFDKLSAERRQERRRKLLEGWFTVRRHSHFRGRLCSGRRDAHERCGVALESRMWTGPVPRSASDSTHEGSWTDDVRSQGEGPCKGVHQAHPTWLERFWRNSFAQLEETNWKGGELLLFKVAECDEILNDNEQKVAGDFPTVLYEVVGKRSSVMDGTLTIQELNDVLDDLSMNNKNQFVI